MRRTIWILICLYAVLSIIPVSAQGDTFFPPPPEYVDVITPENADQLELLATLGRGTIKNMMWSPDGTKLAVKSSIGLWLYDELDEEPFFIEGLSEYAAFDAAWDTIAIQNGTRIDIWNLRTREKREISAGPDKTIYTSELLFYLGGGAELIFAVYGQSGYEVWRWDLTQHQFRDSVLLNRRNLETFTLSPREDVLYARHSGGWPGALILLGDSLELHSLSQPGEPEPAGITFHPVRPLIAYIHDRKQGQPAEIYVFDYAQQEIITSYTVPYSRIKLFFSPDGQHLLARATHDYVGTLYRWDLMSRSVEAGSSDEYFERAFNIVFSPDGRFLVLEGDYRSEVWDLKTLQAIKPVRKNNIVHFSPDGLHVFSRGFTPLRMYSLKTSELVREFGGTSMSALSPDGSIALTDRFERSVVVYPPTTTAEVRTLGGFGPYQTLGFSPQGTALLTLIDRELTLWDIPFAASASLEIPRTPVDRISGMDNAIEMESADLYNNIVQRWTIASGSIPTLEQNEPLDFSAGVPDEPEDQLHHYALDPSRNVLIAAGGEDSGLYGGTPYLFVHDLSTGRYQFIYEHIAPVNALVFSPDGSTLATGSGYVTDRYMSDDLTLRLWDVRRVNRIIEIIERARFYYPDQVNNVVFDPTGRLVAADFWRGISVRDTLTGRELIRFETYSISDQSFSPDSKFLAVKSDYRLRLWDLATGQELVSFPTPEWYSEIYWHPDGTWIATSNNTGVVRLYGVPRD